MSANRVYESNYKVVVKLSAAEIAAAAAAKKSANDAALRAKEAAKAAIEKLKTTKALAALAKLGVKPSNETDPIQLEAARLNLVKQGSIAEQQRLANFMKARQFEIDTNNAATEAAMRYNDILIALSDAKITSDEFNVLAAKWGITTNAAQLYTQTIISVQDQVISSADIVSLAESWGVTYKQAALYLDFFTALNDGNLSDAEIGKLQEKWGQTSKEVHQYAAVFAAADDGKIDLTEITNLANSWGMTKTEAEAYAKKILEKFGYDTSLLDAGIDSKAGWVAAYGSADAYKKISEGAFSYDKSITDGSTAASGGWISAKKAVDDYSAAASGANAQLDALNKKNAAIAAAVAAAGASVGITTPTPTNSGNGYTGNFTKPQLAGMLAGIEGLATGGIVTSPTLSLIGEAGPEAVIPLSQMGAMGGQSVTINIGGSVISEGDLVATIRNQLLNLQQSGKAISLSAISL
jgi:hypothetical protein